MRNESPAPDELAPPPVPSAPSARSEVLEPDSPALATDLEDSFFETRRLRHDGWDGPAMASFCGALAETGIVTEACRACGKSARGAYALRQREPLFSRAWESALTLARERLADDLLARSLKGSSEQIIRDGCIWGERHVYDNKLAFAILRRLDRRAELGATFRTPPTDRIPDPVPAVSGDWQLLLNALSDDRKDDAALLLTPLPPEVHEVHNPPIEGVEGEELEEPYVEKRVWQEFKSGDWRTNFPPPPGFVGDFKSSWEKRDYSRALTDAELDAFTRDSSDNDIVTLEQDEADRDAFFAALAPIAPPPVQAEVSAPADGDDAKPQKPLKSEPPLTSDRSERGASSPGENP